MMPRISETERGGLAETVREGLKKDAEELRLNKYMKHCATGRIKPGLKDATMKNTTMGSSSSLDKETKDSTGKNPYAGKDFFNFMAKQLRNSRKKGASKGKKSRKYKGLHVQV